MAKNLDFTSAEFNDLVEDFKRTIEAIEKRCVELAEKNRILEAEVARLQKVLRQGNVNVLNTAHLEENSCYKLPDRPWYNEWLAMQNSLSWRVTKPLRFLKKIIRKIF